MSRKTVLDPAQSHRDGRKSKNRIAVSGSKPKVSRAKHNPGAASVVAGSPRITRESSDVFWTNSPTAGTNTTGPRDARQRKSSPAPMLLSGSPQESPAKGRDRTSDKADRSIDVPPGVNPESDIRQGTTSGPSDAPRPDPLELFRILSRRAQTGDPCALSDLRALLADESKLVDLFGDVGRFARQGWCNFAAGGDQGICEAMMIKSDQIATLFAGPNATQIERLLTEHVATAWLRLSALSLNETVEAKTWKKPAGDFLLKRHDQAMRQFYDTLRQFHEYRRMLIRTAK